MSKLAWTPWYQVVEVRGDLKSGELSMAATASSWKLWLGSNWNFTSVIARGPHAA